MICAFFGHSDATKEIEPVLKDCLLNLIENEGIDTFYVGNNGNFDKLVQEQLFLLSKTYKIKCFVVLSTIPKNELEIKLDTFLPFGVENVPYRFRIDYRNKWLVSSSDIVVTYVKRNFGGAYKFKCLAEKQNKRIIEL